MGIPLKVPSLGESVTQATIGAWLKGEGDAVKVDEPIVEVESEKATVALPAPVAGVLRRVLKRTGDTVAVGEVIGELEEGAAAEAPSPSGSAPAPGAAVTAKGGNGAPRGAAATPAAKPAATPTPAPASIPFTSGVRRVPPSARRLMAEHGVSAEQVAGSGPGGQVRKEDVVRALEAPGLPPAEARAPAPAQPEIGPRERVVPMTPLRRTVARRLVEAQQTAAILTTFNEIDMSRVLALREKHGEAFLAKHGVKLGFMSFFVKASVEALRAFPAVNAEVRGTDLVYKDHYDVG
ncbi:MAG TPA: 2-oxo acid dehydrogenase subunit E2, partial [Anaeromyxobacter sp.]